MVKVFYSLSEWIEFRNNSKEFENKSIGFVPTMGNLHDGHKSLMIRCVEENDIGILSIFTNPTQFQKKDDLENYPKTPNEDIKMAEKVGIQYVIIPKYDDIYPDDYAYKIVNTSDLASIMEGKTRPGFFDGILTVVLKLFMIVKPNKAYFGEKDYQQYLLVKGLSEAFFLNIDIIPCPIMRNDKGFALSSRNNRLNKEQTELALNFPKILRSSKNCEEAKSKLENWGIKVNYIEEYQGRRFGSIFIDNIILIDNVKLTSCT
ncbi:pantoate--beta-alanine ligase [Pseudomonadota bacterium]